MALKYLRAAATGSGSGNDWTNAYTNAQTAQNALARGDTLYIAGGSYSSVTWNKATSGTTLITVLKATVADHGTSTGWSDSFASTAATFTAPAGSIGWNFSSQYWLIDGVTGGGPGSWTSGFGFVVSTPSRTNPSVGIDVASNVTVRHVEVIGNGGSDDGGSGVNDCIGINTATTNFTLSYAYLHDAGRTIFLILESTTNLLFEYVYTGLFESTAAQHSEMASIGGADAGPGATGPIVFRYCVFAYAESTGGLMYYGSGLRFYGNVYAQGLIPGGGGGNGVVGTWTADYSANALYYNNTFINPDPQVMGILTGGPRASSNTGEFKNNVIYNGPVGEVGVLTHTHNHYVSASGAPSEATGTTASGNPFVDWPNLDFGLTSAGTAGTNLGSGGTEGTITHSYNVDMNGNTRTNWTRGAIEFVSGGGSVPAAPTNLRFV